MSIDGDVTVVPKGNFLRSAAIFLLSLVIIAVVAFSIAIYVSTKTGFLDVRENTNRPLEVEGEVASGQAPCPKIEIKQGKVKFLDYDRISDKKLFWYKIILKQPVFPLTSYTSYVYMIGFRFTFVDGVGSVVGVTDLPATAMLLAGASEDVFMDNPYSFPLATTQKIKAVYVTVKVSAIRR